MRSLLEFEFSAWLIVPCIALGVLYAYLQYTKDVPWSKRTNQWLAVVRATLVVFIAALILGPLIRAIQNYKEDPIMVVAIDNSESIFYGADSLLLRSQINGLMELGAELGDRGWRVQYRDLNNTLVDLDTLSFDQTRTNLTQMMRSIQNEYDGANLGSMLLVSDGIFNTGFSPDLISSYTPIYTVGLGDTIPKADLSIIDLRYSKTVYQENKFPIRLKIKNESMGSVNTTLRLYRGSRQIEVKDISFSADRSLIEEEFILEADEPGKQRYSIQLDPVAGETNQINNRAAAYIDVIDGKQKVLIVAETPNPDIRALRLAIADNEQFLVEVVVNETVPKDKYDLVIYAHAPRAGGKRLDPASISADTPSLFIVGSTSDKSYLATNNILNFASRSGQYDQVTANLNEDFSAFNVLGDMKAWLNKVPPMTVPFGNILLPPNAQVLLYQKVGSVETSRPLIFVNEGESKSGVILGDGFWKWRLDEYRKFGETSRFDELVTKLTKYLASKPDNRQFKLYPVKDGFEEGEAIVFKSETYNEIFEPLYGEIINLKVTGSDQTFNYDFTPIEGNTQIEIDNLPEGLYGYAASTFLNGKRLNVSGQFSVAKPDLEAADLTADHRVLKRIATDSGGDFYSINEINALKNDLARLEAPAILHTQDKELLLLNLPWILMLILGLATAEWLTRKMMGSY